jgi:hypothetical protein
LPDEKGVASHTRGLPAPRTNLVSDAAARGSTLRGVLVFAQSREAGVAREMRVTKIERGSRDRSRVLERIDRGLLDHASSGGVSTAAAAH